MSFVLSDFRVVSGLVLQFLEGLLDQFELEQY
jgi:hypothetical protein